MNNGIIDPVNHKLTQNDLEADNYKSFLDELTDVPSSVPLKSFSINKAGISGQMAYIKVRSLFSDQYVPVLCQIKMQVTLEGHRGIHMSRCEEALFALMQEEHDSLDELASRLAMKLRNLQSADAAFVEIEGTYIAERKTIKTRRTSHDRMTLFANAQATATGIERQIGIAAFNMTGCPCTETFTKFSVAPKLLETGLTLDQVNEILSITNSGTHTQRGQAKIMLDKPRDGVTYKMLYDILDESCHLVFELLKRADEHELVVRVLRKPQFTEDVVRDIIDVCIRKAGRYLEKESRIFASSVLFDSIHIHDVCTEIERSYGELTA
ncbi:MAG TPA: GTP cyclohydrolase, FolE2/MptA family [Candidatus Saccharimonadales bacterium]|nr:GTP cyclohydrolase, FolE2/MptA family [Candidatus Saccharimonadales bacterium]